LNKLEIALFFGADGSCSQKDGPVPEKFSQLVATALMVSGLASCATPGSNTGTARVGVEASFRERLALTPGARLEASLLDVSRADAAAAVVGKTVLEDVGQPPYRFSIAYDPAAIVANHRYAVRVVLLKKNDRLLFTTDQAYPVLTGGHPASVQVLLRRVAGGS
jgi:putative lipoprotein